MGLLSLIGRSESFDTLIEKGFNQLNTLEGIASTVGSKKKLPDVLYHRFKDLPDAKQDIRMFLGECKFDDYLRSMSGKTRNGKSLVKLAYISFVAWKEIGEYLIDRAENPNEREIRLSVTPEATFETLKLSYVELSPLISNRYRKHNIFDGHLESKQRDSVKTVKEIIKIYARNNKLV